MPTLVFSTEVIRTWCDADAVCFDVDSTVCLEEGIDELADFCRAGQAVAQWTAKAMAGSIAFEQALAARLSLFKPSIDQLQDCIEKRPPRISPGIAELIEKIKARNADVYLVSGGFRQMIKKYRYKSLVMIGDGATDLEKYLKFMFTHMAWQARQPGGSDLFICYGGVQMREAVARKADWVVSDFHELMAYLA
ncbi:Phosphoserine phosphatase, chloroplastic [Dichanthelium oligosanthes]|uniref:phosphoserine phosphatase n=1 Tax=Dichanthelium oligosanthes TaxID=888268 RepID=A0A1E5UN07_9POAL|nr:Phosphoserine phosphatase, chloroplastic [Dichanthelium oligosanthes]